MVKIAGLHHGKKQAFKDSALQKISHFYRPAHFGCCDPLVTDQFRNPVPFWGPKRTGSLTFGGLLTREKESFAAKSRGDERYLHGSCRTPRNLARNRDTWPSAVIVASPWQNSYKCKNAGRSLSRRFRKPLWRHYFAHKPEAPRVGLEPTTNRLTAGCSTIELSGKNPHRRTSFLVYVGNL